MSKIDNYTREELVDGLLKYDSAIKWLEELQEDNEDINHTLVRFKRKLNE